MFVMTPSVLRSFTATTDAKSDTSELISDFVRSDREYITGVRELGNEARDLTRVTLLCRSLAVAV